MTKRLFLFLALVITTVLSAQDLSGIKVDNLSDAQIRSILAQGQSQGLNIEQGEQLALQMGLSPEEAKKFKARAAGLNGAGAANSSASGSLITTEVAEKAEIQVQATANSAGEEVGAKAPKAPVSTFGQQIFREGDLKIYERSLDAKAPSNYVLGEGDELGVSVFGTSYFQKEYTVDSRGNIAMETWGKINVRGLTFEQVQKLIKARISPYFNMGSNEMTVTLSYSRSITVNIVGDVLHPGSYKMPAVNTAFNALVAAGGPSNSGTLRDIQILRDGKVVQHLDVYAFLLNPNSKSEFYLQDNDYLFVGPAANVVSIQGEITRPMAYELLPTESVESLIQYAGGLTAEAYADRIQIERQAPNDITLIEVPAQNFSSTYLKRGDSVRVSKSNGIVRRFVTIDGAVMQPGTYSFEEGMTAKAAILLAGGTLPDVVRSEAYISRLKEDQTMEFIPFNLDLALSGKGPALQNKDRINILGVPDFDENMALSIQGAVRDPKTIAFAEGMTLGDVLRLAGGLQPNADYTRVEVNRLNAFGNYQGGTSREVRTTALITAVPQALSKTLDIEDASLEFALQPYDQVIVREIPDFELQNLVFVSGEVQYPGYYALLSKDEKLVSLITRAGGLTAYASAKNASLSRVGYPNISMDLNSALSNKASRYNISLVEGDVLDIPRTESLITITGPATKYYLANGELELNAPFVPGRRANQYVSAFALGYAKKANRAGTYLTYENGQYKRALNFGLFRIHPVVKRGATIHTVLRAPKEEKSKREVKPMDWNQVVATLTSAIMGFSTVYVLLTR
jgi:protein involved in polysaccharide export with SLBB domain